MLEVWIGIDDGGGIAIGLSLFASACVLAATMIIVAVIGRD